MHPEIRETTGDLCTAYRILITCHLPRLKEVNNFLSRKSSSLSISSYLEACWILKFIYVNTGRATQCTTEELSLPIQRDSKLKVCSIRIKWSVRTQRVTTSGDSQLLSKRILATTRQCTWFSPSPSPSPRLSYDPIRINPGLVCLVLGTRD